jgi:hypothetical protein
MHTSSKDSKMSTEGCTGKAGQQVIRETAGAVAADSVAQGSEAARLSHLMDCAHLQQQRTTT